MRKILLTLFAVLLAFCVNAQVGGTPRELACTEEAFTFKANIGSGWHLSQFSMGPPETAKIVTAYSQGRTFRSDVADQKISSVPSFTNSLGIASSQRVAKRYISSGNPTALNALNFQFDKLYYVIPYSRYFGQLKNLNMMKGDF